MKQPFSVYERWMAKDLMAVPPSLYDDEGVTRNVRVLSALTMKLEKPELTAQDHG
jgi:hypothetical protein